MTPEPLGKSAVLLFLVQEFVTQLHKYEYTKDVGVNFLNANVLCYAKSGTFFSCEFYCKNQDGQFSKI